MCVWRPSDPLCCFACVSMDEHGCGGSGKGVACCEKAAITAEHEREGKHRARRWWKANGDPARREEKEREKGRERKVSYYL
ncbi:hypothetical protein KSD_96930 [Ktedonobacter sp. SOSP1-85]|nr:hypothetical protein KSD_96930 [Ktedonobacter sp. SOSP1-85]